VKNGELQKLLNGIITRGDKHIKEECQVCRYYAFPTTPSLRSMLI